MSRDIRGLSGVQGRLGGSPKPCFRSAVSWGTKKKERRGGPISFGAGLCEAQQLETGCRCCCCCCCCCCASARECSAAPTAAIRLRNVTLLKSFRAPSAAERVRYSCISGDLDEIGQMRPAAWFTASL